ncbi:nucleotide sugar dehydrogenase [Candidatus Peregrinibacteria bacterium]|nr:nucleotide sugar dehydrogenase [Candidatus Peregrinibacteria bacterium]
MKTVAILGLGYVGFPLVELLIKTKRYRVIGLDISPQKIIQAKSALKSKFFTATADFSLIKQADVSVVCVPTPVYKNFLPDYGPVKNACLSIAKNLKPGQLIIIESTINPGTCEEVVLPILERYGAIAGKDFLLAHCPERIDPGNKKWTLVNIPRNVGGIDKQSALEAAAFYRSFLKSEVKVLNSIKAAEATKIVENTFRDINIAYVNELAMSFDKLGIDILEVIKGAKTKPFAFMPHYPGAGVGGHCFEKTQIVFIKTKKGIETFTFEELFKYIENMPRIEKEDFKILSFDLKTQKSCFKKLLLVTKRPCDTVLRLRTKYGFELKVTDQHPVIIYRNGVMTTCFAKDIRLNDLFVINKTIPSFNKKYTIDAINEVKNSNLHNKIRIGLKNSRWENFAKQLSPVLKDNKRVSDTYYHYNFLPLPVYLQAKQKNLVTMGHKGLLLKTGRGPSSHSIPAVIETNKDLCRLIGYYLSEGCLTKDKSSRIRFSFHSQEHEYLRDVRNILRQYDIPFSEYTSKQWRSSGIKISSEILGEIIQNTLGCGTNCYSMNIPAQLLAMPQTFRKEIVKGMLRGDGGVEMTEGKRFYKKNSKQYFHENNSASTNYFSSSKKLFQQIIAILLDQNIFPKIQKREGLLRISGYDDLKKMDDYFDGEKQKLLMRSLNNKKKIINRDKSLRHETFFLAPVTSTEILPTDTVYSAEVENTHTIVTSYGIVAHNCIPVDPYYLIERALHSGFEHRFLEMARKVNNGMPAYTVSLLENEAEKLKLPMRKITVGLLGLAYKKDIADVRESPALQILKILKSKRLKIEVFDPFLLQKSTVKDLKTFIKKCDAVILVTNHSLFEKNLVNMLKKSGVKILIDGRNCIPKKQVTALGIAYKGIGH